MEDCRKKNFKKYDWLIFFDMDEFLFLRNYTHIQDYLNQRHFNKCQRIYLNWFFHTDNNLLYYDNRSLVERFPEKKISFNGKYLILSSSVKSILKGNIDVKIISPHNLNRKLIGCNGFGYIKNVSYRTDEPDHYYYYIDHYYSKSTEEFVKKIARGGVAKRAKNNKYDLCAIKAYFSFNEITKEKIDYIENKTKYNLTKYRLLINKIHN